MHLLSLLTLIGLLGSSAVTAFPYRDSPYFRGNDCNNRCDAWSACMRSGLSARCTPVPTTQCKCFDNPPPSMLSLFFHFFPRFLGEEARDGGRDGCGSWKFGWRLLAWRVELERIGEGEGGRREKGESFDDNLRTRDRNPGR